MSVFGLDRGVSRVRLSVEAAYVLTVASMAAIATGHSPTVHLRVWVAVLVLALPAMVAMLPVLYVAVSTVVNVTRTDNGWLVTATYVAVLTSAAVLNVFLVRTITKRRALERRWTRP